MDSSPAPGDGHDPRGLSAAEVAARQRQFGPNALPAPPGRGIALRLLDELRNPFALLLVCAAIASVAVTREQINAVVILAVVVFSAVVGAAQGERSDRAVRALRGLVAPRARAWRSGSLVDIPAAELVPGDLVEVAAGDRVPADMRLIESTGLQVDEASLTGESLPVEKDANAPSTPDLPLADRRAEAFAGTFVTAGHGTGVVTATGGATAVGGVAAMLGSSPSSPLEHEVREASGRMAGLAVVVGAGIAVLSVWRGGWTQDSVVDGVVAGIAIAVAAVPEGLLAVTTTALAIGGQRMARRGAIVRHLPAIEALGSATVLCTDKTGTLTTGRLDVVEVQALPGCEDDLWLAALRCNNATATSGDPLESAIIRAAGDHGLALPSVEVRLRERPFSPATRDMRTVHRTAEGRTVLAVKGAPEAVLGACTPGPGRDQLDQTALAMANRGLRVIAVASAQDEDLDVAGLQPLGLIGLRDTLRGSTALAVQQLEQAGIRLVMVTGDHLGTARAIAREAGLADTPAVSGAELAKATPAAREQALREARIVARVDPGLKVELVEAHRAAGDVVAMTGDGVNDAPALRKADVGVALLGGDGTDIAREAADVVVVDSDLRTVVAAVREGRVIYRNLVNVVTYLLAGNVSEIAIIVGGSFLIPDLPLVLLPVQILWINLLTDGLPAIALGVDQPASDVLRESPRSPGESLLGGRRQLTLLARGVGIGALVLLTGLAGRLLGWEPEEIRTQVFLSLVVVHLALAYVVRSDRVTFGPGWWRNWVLLLSVGGSFALQVLVVATHAGRSLLHIQSPPAVAFVIAVGAAVFMVVAVDLWRTVIRPRLVTRPHRP